MQSNKLYLDTPRQYRLAKALIEQGRVWRKDLDDIVGALNSPQVKMEMLNNGWPIVCERVSVRDQDGKVCRPGYYVLSQCAIDEAIQSCIRWEKMNG